jgi:hypothetical protein
MVTRPINTAVDKIATRNFETNFLLNIIALPPSESVFAIGFLPIMNAPPPSSPLKI